jgi:homoserine/homoserine lactone efflux protein
MTLETWLLFMLVSLLPAISPGPGILLAISNALRFGRNAALWSGAGNAVGLAILGFAVTMGLGAVMAASAILFTAIKYVGAVYLLYLGFKLLRDKSAFKIDTTGSATQRTNRQFFTTALFVSLTNPKAIFIIAALFPQFIGPETGNLVNTAILSVTYATMCYINHVGLAIFGGRMRQFLQSDHIAKWLRRTLGAAFIGFGTALATFSR